MFPYQLSCLFSGTVPKVVESGSKELTVLASPSSAAVNGPEAKQASDRRSVDEQDGSEPDVDKEGEEDEDEEEHATSTLVDHPVPVLVHERLWHIGRDGGRGCGVGALKALEPAPLGLVALEVARTISADDDVGVLLERGDLAV